MKDGRFVTNRESQNYIVPTALDVPEFKMLILKAVSTGLRGQRHR